MQVAEVKIWGRVVGAVAWDEERGYATFEYDPGFRQSGLELAPLKMAVSDGPGIFSFPELRRERNAAHDTFKGLPGLLADALPDAYGNQLMHSPSQSGDCLERKERRGEVGSDQSPKRV